MDPFVESEIKRVTLMLEIEYGPGKPENVKYYNEGNKYTMTFLVQQFLDRIGVVQRRSVLVPRPATRVS